jgi:hypothetical protein
VRAFKKQRALSTSKIDLELRKKLVKCCVWGIALCGADTFDKYRQGLLHEDNAVVI